MNAQNKAQRQNPALEPLAVLVGEWATTGTHPYVPGKIFHGKSVCEWIEGGAFLMMHSEIDEPEIPSGISIFGSDNMAKEFFMMYFDERGISRKYDVSFENNMIVWSRNDSAFSQRMILTVADDGKTLKSRGEMSKNGGNWEPDLELTYIRVS